MLEADGGFEDGMGGETRRVSEICYCSLSLPRSVSSVYIWGMMHHTKNLRPHLARLKEFELLFQVCLKKGKDGRMGSH